MTDKEKLDAIRAEVEEYISAARKAHTNITEGNFAHLLSFIDSLQEEPVNKDFEMALTEMIDKAQKCVVEPIVVAQQWKDCLVHLAKSEEPVKDRFAFKAIPRLLDMIEPTDKAKSYVTKLADAFDSEGYYTDAKIVRESLKIMNGEKVAMATMDEEPVSEGLEKIVEEIAEPTILNAYGTKELARRLRNTIGISVSEDLEDAAYHNCIDRLSKESIEDFKAGARWQKQKTIDKACEYLYLHCNEVKTEDNGIAGWIDNEFINNFKQAMNYE